MDIHDKLQVTRRHLPHWQLIGSTYFLTFRIVSGILTPAERTIVMDHLRSGHSKFYNLIALVVMPDHAHALLRPNDGVDLPRITKGIKGVSARLINLHRNASGRVWQEESFDRIIRDSHEYDEKVVYMINNPVKAGLVMDPWEYPWLFVARRMDG